MTKELAQQDIDKDIKIAYLKRKARLKETSVLLLYTALVAILCFFIKVGIDRLVNKYSFLRKSSLLSHAIIYSVIILLFFPTVGCVVSDWYLNLKDISEAKGHEVARESATSIPKQGFIRAWWNDFKSPENLSKNLAYYPIITITNIFLAGLWYITKLGIDELVPAEGNPHALPLKISLTIISVVSLAIISVTFSMSLMANLWRESPPISIIQAPIAEKNASSLGAA